MTVSTPQRRTNDITDNDTARATRAVIYARVSTNKQADKDIDPEGYSLPAQQEACYRKAMELGAEVVEVYVDRGESAKTTDRPNFLRMIKRIQTDRDIDFVILDKINRFARNRRDDANVLFDLRTAGAKVISVKENIDETPAGMLMHGILATIAEYESRNNGVEALKGMTRKAQVGGTPGRAPIGYINVGRRIDGREVRVVTIDPEKAPLIQWAFEAYATGEWTVEQLAEALREQGLRALPHGRKPGEPIHRSRVANLLSNRYYLGYVSFRGAEYQGRHQPLVPQQTFDTVQEILQSRNRAGEKQRKHHHYLKGSIFCARCGSRLCLTNAKGSYLYYFCIGRHQKRTSCTQPYILAETIEAAVEQYYATVVRLPEEIQATITEGLRLEIERQRLHAAPEIDWARRRVVELEDERRRLARGVVEGTIPGDLAREEHERIDRERDDAVRTLAASELIYANIDGTLRDALDVLGKCDEIYRRGAPRVRRLLNQAIFEKLLVHDDTIAGAVYREPWSTFVRQDFQRRMERNTKNPDRVSCGRGSNKNSLAPSAGFEPAHTAPEVFAPSR